MKPLHRLLPAIVVVAGASFLTQRGSALAGDPLAVGYIQNLVTGAHAILPTVNYQVAYSTGMFSPPAYPLFDQYALTMADVGRTFTVTAANDPDFVGFTQNLTDGLQQGVVLKDSQGGTLTRSEPVFFTLLPSGGNGIDLQGFTIGSIDMYIDALTIDSPGSNQSGDGNWTDIYFRATITVNAIPEPPAFVLAVVFAAVPMFLRRRK